MELFKIQRPIAGAPDLLVYNEDRSIMQTMPMSAPGADDVLEHMGEQLKVYWPGYPDEDGMLQLFPNDAPDCEPEW